MIAQLHNHCSYREKQKIKMKNGFVKVVYSVLVVKVYW